jgi:GH24 family phage-related lysozyme (muramidase)
VAISSRLIKQLQDDEQSGKVALVSYLCPTGHWTIGWGHNLEAHPDPKYPAQAGTTCTKEQADTWLVDDARLAESGMLRRWPWMSTLPLGVYEACINLCFNMGVGTFSAFVNTLRALQAHDFETAAYELEHSAWYLQTGNRAKRVVAQVRRGL